MRVDALFYLLPIVFAVVGWVTEYYELYGIGGAFGFFAAYTLISEGSLTDLIMFQVIIYIVFSISIFMRIITESTREAE